MLLKFPYFFLAYLGINYLFQSIKTAEKSRFEIYGPRLLFKKTKIPKKIHFKIKIRTFYN